MQLNLNPDDWAIFLSLNILESIVGWAAGDDWDVCFVPPKVKTQIFLVTFGIELNSTATVLCEGVSYKVWIGKRYSVKTVDFFGGG